MGECDKLRELAKSQCEEMRCEAQKEIDDKRKELEAQKAMLQAERDAMETVHAFQTSKVSLDVGGHKFTTSLQTLRSVPDTFLSSMFSGRFALEKDDNGCYFVDRDGEHFRCVLNYLRDPTKFTLKGMPRRQQA